ncbi:hypothetical protein FHX42_000914 [Saccharopolyspora lacisalsi]|uniref:DUF397 domain-containing protein n=1 Tax=Halosaccharopolyspora lacisalsi TaxID=1000566 RepID=A0A839DW85_9PSEU|nr:hypothetical protein [Halosaccharopolyspora lacisalsi]
MAGGVALRDSKEPDGPVLRVDRQRWSVFLHRLNG